MSILTLRLLDGVTLNAQSALSAVVDLGEYLTLDIIVRVAQAGTAAPADDGGTGAVALVVQHAPTDDDASYLDLPDPVSVDLTATGATWVHADHYTRYVRLTLSGHLEGDAVVTVDLVAKR